MSEQIKKGVVTGLWRSKKYQIAMIWWVQCTCFAIVGLMARSAIIAAAALAAAAVVLAGYQIAQGLEDAKRGPG